MAEAVSIEEGFICPGCLKDLRSPDGLLKHFQEAHSGEQAILNLKSVKELYDKAKKKILKVDDKDLETFSNQIQSSSNIDRYENYTEPQEIGQIRSHIKEFKAARRDRLDHRTTETNKLIIRLDRLLRCDTVDRKQQEQVLVTWLDGTTVKRCPSCTAGFNLTRRQHHCRLCGCIMCNSCSHFLLYDIAQTIVAPVYNVDLAASGKDKDNVAKECDTIRICIHCSIMLETRRRAQIEQIVQPVICQLYSHLQMLKSRTQNSVDMYYKMYNSLTAGESTFQLQDAQSLRCTIAKNAEMIDVLSKKIATLTVETPRSTELQNNIRKSASNYIKNYLLTLPNLPTIQELAAIKRDVSLKYSKDEMRNPSQLNLKKITVTTGWSPDTACENIVQKDDDDPLMVQINIVRDYINQARKAQRFEEVAVLRENLKSLKEAYKEHLKEQ